MIYTLTALCISLTILGIHYTLESVLNNVLGVSLDDIYEKYGKISMPLIVCPTCMTSFWGSLLIIAYPAHFEFVECFFILFQIGFFNYVFTKIIHA